jgi:hypothetical protein
VSIHTSDPAGSFVLSMMKPPSKNAGEEANKHFVALDSVEDLTVQPQRTLKFWLSCMPTDIGLHSATVDVKTDEEDIVQRIAFLLADDNVSVKLFSDEPCLRECNFQKKKYACKHRPYVLSEELSMKNYLVFFTSLLGMEKLHLKVFNPCNVLKC